MTRSSIFYGNTQGKYASENVLVDDDTSALIARLQRRISADCVVQVSVVGRGIRAAVICPTMVYGAGKGMEYDGNQVPKLTIKSIKEETDMHIGKGLNIWSNVFVNGPSSLCGWAVCQAPLASSFFTDNSENTMREVTTGVSFPSGFGGRTDAWDLAEAEAGMADWPHAALKSIIRACEANARQLPNEKQYGPSLSVAVGARA